MTRADGTMVLHSRLDQNTFERGTSSTMASIGRMHQESRLVGSRRGRKRALVQSARHRPIHQFTGSSKRIPPRSLDTEETGARASPRGPSDARSRRESSASPLSTIPELERHIDIALNVGLIGVREGRAALEILAIRVGEAFGVIAPHSPTDPCHVGMKALERQLICKAS
jgi:hypothetical protein